MSKESNSPPENRNARKAQDPALDLETLFLEFSDQLARIAWAILRDSQLATDAVQESFALLTEKLLSVPPDQRKGWLVRTVQFQSKNLLRKHNRQQPTDNQNVLESEVVPDLQQSLELQDDLQRVKSLILRLPVEQQIVLRMRFEEEKTFAEIAKETGVPLGTALSRVRLAIAMIRTGIDSE